MSTSLLYHGFGVRGYNLVHTHFKSGEVIFTVKQDPSTLRCAHCNSRLVGKRGKLFLVSYDVFSLYGVYVFLFRSG